MSISCSVPIRKSELSKFINAYKSASSRLIKRVSGDPAEALEGNVLESELLPPECRRSSDRSDPSVHRDTGEKNMNVVYRFRIYPNKIQQELFAKTFDVSGLYITECWQKRRNAMKRPEKPEGHSGKI